MTAHVTPLPEKTREQQWAVWDSTRLNGFAFRPDDILINTWSKSGTTWMQQIVGQLIFKGDPDAYGQERSLWPEIRLLKAEEVTALAAALQHRRFFKSHSPLSAIPFREDMKYIFVGRDTRDVVWSLFHHHTIMTQVAPDAFNNAPGLVGPPIMPAGCDVVAYYHHFLDHGFFPGFSKDVDFWPHIQGWWDHRHLPNVIMVHYANLKNDLEGEARRIARFLDIEVDAKLWPQIVQHCSLSHMKQLAGRFELLDMIFEGGGKNFINKGTNGRWKEILRQDEIEKCDRVAARNLTPDCAHWLKTGEL